MTTLTVTPNLRPATRFDRMILRVSAGLQNFVLARLERRAGNSAAHQAAAAQDAAAQARATAQALGALGILPR